MICFAVFIMPLNIYGINSQNSYIDITGRVYMNLLAKFCGRKDVADPQREKWISELNKVKNELDSNEMLFNMTDDFNLTEYAIHKNAALEARYSYLMRLIRRYDEACSNKLPSDRDINDELILENTEGQESNIKSLQR